MLERWSPFTSNEILLKLGNEKIAVATYNRRLSMLKNYVKWLVKKKHLHHEILDDVKPRRKERTTKELTVRTPFTDEQVVKILDAMKNNTHCAKSATPQHSFYYPFLYFLLRTGTRNGEAIGLKTKDLDFDKRIITIQRSFPKRYQKVTDKKGNVQVKYIRKECPPKKGGRYEQRYLPMDDNLYAVLYEQVKDREPDDLVFYTPRSKSAIDDHNFQQRVFYPLLERLDIPKRNLYACRHTQATKMVNNTGNIARTAQLLGNSAKMIEQVYLHRLDIKEDDLPSWD
jgi:integrase